VKPARARHAVPMKATLELTARMIVLGAEDTAPCCPRCKHVLDLHQPDENLPNRLLATCDSCLRWYCLFGTGEDSDSNQFFMLGLPDKSMIEAARFTNGLDAPE
jgi:hypothetical protein